MIYTLKHGIDAETGYSEVDWGVSKLIGLVKVTGGWKPLQNKSLVKFIQTQ